MVLIVSFKSKFYFEDHLVFKNNFIVFILNDIFQKKK